MNSVNGLREPDKRTVSVNELVLCSKACDRSMSRRRGFTLLEMLITLAISAIILTVVAPSVQNILAKNRMTSEINELSALIQFARFTAIDQSSRTLVCPASDYANCGTNWDQAKIVFVDDNNNSKRDASEPLLTSTQGSSNNNTMTGPNTPLVFLDSGAATAAVSVKICPNSATLVTARAININAQGRVRLSVDSNNDGVYEDTDGNALTCT